MHKVCHIILSHDRRDTRVFYKECLTLSRWFDVYLHAYDGLENEEKQGVKIIGGKSPGGKFRKFFLFPFNFLAKRENRQYDLYHLHEPDTYLLVILLSVFLRKKVVMDVHERFKEQIDTRDWIPENRKKAFKWFYTYLEKMSSSVASAVVVALDSMLPGFNNKRLISLRNLPILKEGQLDRDRSASRKTKLIYVGAITVDRGILNILNLALVTTDDFEFTIIGGIPEPQKERITSHPGWSKIDYLGYVDFADLPKYLLRADFGLLLLNRIGQYEKNTFNVKLFEYMQYGLPTLMPDYSEWVKFNQQYGMGINANVASPDDIMAKLQPMLASPETYKKCSKQCQIIVRKEFSWQSESKKLITLYEDIFR